MFKNSSTSSRFTVSSDFFEIITSALFNTQGSFMKQASMFIHSAKRISCSTISFLWTIKLAFMLPGKETCGSQNWQKWKRWNLFLFFSCHFIFTVNISFYLMNTVIILKKQTCLLNNAKGLLCRFQKKLFGWSVGFDKELLTF